MDKANNIYSYKAPKSKNEETHFLLTNGRISLKAFILRLLLSALLMGLSNFLYYFYAIKKYHYWINKGNGVIRNNTFLSTFSLFEKFNFIFLPLILLTFIAIQGAKRIHDVNKSGWFILVPFYNIILLFSNGTIGSNNYGIDHRPQKEAKYFDEIKD